MGLDVYAYSGLTIPLDEDEGFSVYAHPDFTGRLEGIAEGRYEASNVEDVFGGGYGRYGRWREHLAQLAGYKARLGESYFGNDYSEAAWRATEGPFWEMINFADNEGAIGPVVSAKLAKDFGLFQDKANDVGGEFLTTYNAFRKGFELAADNGVVVFS